VSLRITIIAVGTRMPDWVQTGVNDYQKRFGPDINLQWKEIALGNRGKNADIARAMANEGEQMLAAIGKGDRVVALDVKGKSWSTEQLARELAQWQQGGQGISLLIGGPDGLSADCLVRADQKWSLSALTLPHPLVRILLVEQLYRASSINHNHPYHRC
jgi:23S rRNA (pseudouridine1915-N3)-methyltransferase